MQSSASKENAEIGLIDLYCISMPESQQKCLNGRGMELDQPYGYPTESKILRHRAACSALAAFSAAFFRASSGAFDGSAHGPQHVSPGHFSDCKIVSIPQKAQHSLNLSTNSIRAQLV